MSQAADTAAYLMLCRCPLSVYLGIVTRLKPQSLKKEEKEVGLLLEKINRHVPADGPESARGFEGKDESVGDWSQVLRIRGQSHEKGSPYMTDSTQG